MRAHPTKFTEEQLAIIRKHFPTKPCAVVAKMIGVSTRTLSRKASNMGVAGIMSRKVTVARQYEVSPSTYLSKERAKTNEQLGIGFSLQNLPFMKIPQTLPKGKIHHHAQKM